MSFAFDPIGIVHSLFDERAAAPRQASVGQGIQGTIQLFPGHGYEDALEGLDGWEYAWIVFVFHKNVEQGRGWRPKVQPPRSDSKHGVFATRSPHRPNPIGLSAVKIERVDGLVIHVRNLDVLDGTPVLDIKPYVAYADAYPHATSGWLETSDPGQSWQVAFADQAQAQLAWLRTNGVDVRAAIEAALSLGPRPHAYRRIRRTGDGMTLALKDWRVDFAVESVPQQTISVLGVRTGYRAKDLAQQAPEVHRAFVATFYPPRSPRVAPTE
jgi:tRNA-Thr(GGU) m(6)t(6)A37 methyltransferase TsaA